MRGSERMYAISLRMDFIAQHMLPNASGRERELHSHPYAVEVTVFGEHLDGNGYLVDLGEMDQVMGDIIDDIRDRPLNDLPDLQHLSPSLENFTRMFWHQFVSALDTSRLSSVRVRIWENTNAYACYEGKVVK
jgi:6-pyruvoyltetrahydropterin/6-carboxytetrahydropterin synthase